VRPLHFHRGLLLAVAIPAAMTAVVVAPALPGWTAFAQDAGLRSGDDLGAFPTSPSVSPSESNAPPTIDGSSAAADNQTPAREPAAAQNNEDPGAPNYGKPRKLKPKLYKPNPKTSPPLPPLVPYRGAPGPQQRALNPSPADRAIADAPEPGPTVAVIPSPLRPKRPLVDTDPFAPTGVRVGELRLLPFLETSAGYETNPNQVQAGVKPSTALRVEGGVDVASDFSNHSLTASLRGGYSEFPSNSNANRPDLSALIDGRIDVTRHDTIDLETRFTLATQTPGSPLLAVPNSVYITSRPTITSEGLTVGGTHTFNRLAINLRGTFDRTQYGDATQSDGSIFRYSQDNYNDYGIVARASYELNPAIIPYVEAGADSRVRDNAADLSGYYRDSVGVLARAGSTFEFSRIFTGTVSAGYADRHYADPRLPNLRGPTLDGSLAYAVTPITTITARASTALSETTLAGASGAISRSFSLELAHVFFRGFTVSGIVTYQPNEYQGVAVNEAYMQYTLKAAYNFTRDVQLIGSASHQALNSTLVGNGFTDNIVLLGVRLQR
jgi:hypothetical protein